MCESSVWWELFTEADIPSGQSESFVQFALDIVCDTSTFVPGRSIVTQSESPLLNQAGPNMTFNMTLTRTGDGSEWPSFLDLQVHVRPPTYQGQKPSSEPGLGPQPGHMLMVEIERDQRAKSSNLVTTSSHPVISPAASAGPGAV